MQITIETVNEMACSTMDEVISSGVSGDMIGVVTSALVALRLSDQRTRPTIGIEKVNSPSIESIPLTFREWADSRKLGSHRDKFLAAAGYLYDEDNISEFSTSDLVELYGNARWSLPKNPADIIGKAANDGLFTEVRTSDAQLHSSKKLWILTRSGYLQYQNQQKEA